MTKVSRYLLDPGKIREFEKTFWNSIALCNSREELKLFFESLFTSTEILMFSKRIQIAKMLLEGNDYKTIESFVRIGSPTISRIKEWLKKEGVARKKIDDLIRLELKEKEKFEKRIAGYPYKRRKDLAVSAAEALVSFGISKVREAKRKSEILREIRKIP